jgi:SAM-dependent methyltransferase
LLPIPHFDPRDRASLRDLGLGLGAFLRAVGNDARNGFLHGRTTKREALVTYAASPDLFRDMERVGLLIGDDDEVTLPFQIRLVDDNVIVTDHPISNWRAEEHYIDPLWRGPTLNKLLIRGAARRALDVGCGCGVMTLAASAFCERVVGVDINPRAVVVARLNVALNGAENVEIADSDLFAAVRGQTFDRILFNSPTGFELRPRTDLEAGEQILARFFSEVLDYLTEDGYAQLSVCFMDRRRSSFWQRLGGWLAADANRLQLVLLERFRMDGGPRFFIQRALASLQDRSNGFDVTAMSRGWLVLRRGDPLALRVPLDYATLSDQLRSDFGDVLVRLLLSRGRIGGDELKTLQIAPHDVLADSLSRMETIPWS